jgi:hypothetical protein
MQIHRLVRAAELANCYATNDWKWIFDPLADQNTSDSISDLVMLSQASGRLAHCQSVIRCSAMTLSLSAKEHRTLLTMTELILERGVDKD